MAHFLFLGGTCNDSTWRKELKTKISCDWFDPVKEVWRVAENWDERHQITELIERKNCRFNLYTITYQMHGVYSIAEVVEDSIKNPQKTILCLIENGFDREQWKSLMAVAKLVATNGAYVCFDLDVLADKINQKWENTLCDISG